MVLGVTFVANVCAMETNQTSEQGLQEQINRLREELDDKNETIFDLQIALGAADVEMKYRIETVQRETSQTVRRLEEELRRLQHEANRLNSSNKRKIAQVDTTITPTAKSMTIPGMQQQLQLEPETTSMIMASAVGVVEATVNSVPSTLEYKTPTAAAKPSHSSRIQMHSTSATTTATSSAHRLLLHLVTSSTIDSSNIPHALLQRLWLAQTDIQITKILVEEWESSSSSQSEKKEENNQTSGGCCNTIIILKLLHQVLDVSPASCRYMVGGTPHKSLCQLRIGGTLVSTINDHDDLLSPLWTPNNTADSATIAATATAVVIESNHEPSPCIDALWQTLVSHPDTIAAWDILRILVYGYRLPWSPEQQTPILRRMVAAGRSCTAPPRRLGLDDALDLTNNSYSGNDDDDKNNRDENDASSTTPLVVWLASALRLVTEYVRRIDSWETLLSKSWATWISVVLDVVQQNPPMNQYHHPHDDETIIACIQFLTVLAAQHHIRALETFLRVEIVTDATTAELWHRAPSAITILCQRLTQTVNVETTVTEEAYLFQTEQPSAIVLELIRFVYYIVIAVQEARRQETTLALWDICPAESLSGTTALLLERTRNVNTQRMLQVILDELEEDYNERYAKYI